MPDTDLDDVQRRARKRWLIMMGSLVVAVAIGVPLLNPLIDGRPKREHHHSGVGGLVAAIAIILVGLAVLFVIGRKTWRNQGRFAAPLIGGLKRRDRRRATRAIRRGEPSADPVLAEVERMTAERTVQQAGFSSLIFIVFVLLELVEALTQSRTGARVFFGVSALFFLVMFGFLLHTVRGARRYLSRV
jgi:hypothetical protein